MKKIISILLVIASMLSIFTLTVVAETSTDPLTSNFPKGYSYSQTASGVEFKGLLASSIRTAPDECWGTGISTPTTIELQHSGKKNGTLISTFSIWDSGLPGRTSFRIMESTDGGVTWTEISKVKETIDTSIEACWNPHLLELPEDFGGMPKGTLLLAGGSIDPSQERKSHITIWRSYDCGITWDQFTVVSEGGGLYEVDSDTTVDAGVWEPYLFYDNGYLYCFYSDDTGDGVTSHSQKVVYRRSNGQSWTKSTNDWEAIVDVVAPSDKYSYRPGMGIVTKMGNGEYFIVYEMFTTNDDSPDVYYKKTSNIAEWDNGTLTSNETLIEITLSSSGLSSSKYSIGGAPWCAWTPIGKDENGTLIVSGRYGVTKSYRFGTHTGSVSDTDYILVSYDCGQTFERILNPLPYEATGGDNRCRYSPSMFFSADGTTLFYSDTLPYKFSDQLNGKVSRTQIAFAKVSILDYSATLGSTGFIGNTEGSTFDATVKINGWKDTKKISAVIDVPTGLTVTNVTPSKYLSGGSISYTVSNGKLNITYENGSSNLSFSATNVQADIFNVTFSLDSGFNMGDTYTVTFESLSSYSIRNPNQTITVGIGADLKAGVLYTSDGSDVIPEGKKAILVSLTQISGVKKLTYSEGNTTIEFKYNKALSENLATDVDVNHVAYVAIVDTDISIDAFKVPNNYILSDVYTEITFGDVDSSKELNAQDALAVINLWLAGYKVNNLEPNDLQADDAQILVANVNGDGCIDTRDALGIIEAFISNNVEYEVVKIATTLFKTGNLLNN